MPLWWTGLLNNLSTWLVNPTTFLLGSALVAVPIIIHLLNQRKFKIVDWAAMDFLLEADKKNRRRVRLENWLLLLMRCLAVFILGMLLARPFDGSGVIASLTDAQQFERILVIDDSLSMQAMIGNRSAMEVARERAVDLVRIFAEDKAENALTVLVTSKPEQRKFNGSPITPDNVEEIVEQLSRLEPTDEPAKLEQSLQELEDYLVSQPPNVNRVAYVLSDMRRRDWQPPGETTNATGPVELLRKIAKIAKGCFVVDIGADDDKNLVVRDVRTEKTLTAGVDSRFEVVVANPGSTAVRDVRIKLAAGDAVPLTRSVDVIEPGEEITETFQVAFAGPDEEASNDGGAFHRVKVEASTAAGGADDLLPLDSQAFFSAHVVPGISTLLVDGDPSAAFGKSETFYLKRALQPPGKTLSGVVVEVAPESELETLDLTKYQVVFLCNLYRLNEKAIEDLRKWVEAGGGLVILPGDQVDEEFFNTNFYGAGDEEGKALSPVRLETIAGDEAEVVWANFKIENEKHPVLANLAGQQNPLLNNAKIFRWWKLKSKTATGIAPANVLLRFSDAEESPAMVERAYGKGRVVAAAIPADADWATWSSDPSYILIMQELVRYLAPGDAREGNVRIGEPLRKVIDLTRYEPEGELVSPGDKKTNLQAAPLAGAEANRWLLEAKDTSRQGFYDLKLARREMGTESILFAGNVDPEEGDLRRADATAMRRELKGSNVQFVAGVSGLLGESGAQTEIWRYLLWLLIGLLLGEQVLGWAFGLRR